MCGRFIQHHSPQQMKDWFQVQQMRFEFGPRYNVAPTQNTAVVTVNRDCERAPDGYRWGLVLSWARDESIGNKMINARAETVGEKPSFKPALHKRRCPDSGGWLFRMRESRQREGAAPHPAAGW